MKFTREKLPHNSRRAAQDLYWNPETAPVGIPKPLARDRIALSAEIANGM